ncbi:MAG: hypothetical protein AB1941_14410 [Gemmatimonadota bacterium]
MRVGDVSVRLVPVGGGEMLEGEDGRVLARPRQVYAIRLENHSDRRAVAKVSLDGLPVTEGGLVLSPGEAMTLERPTTEGEHGRFTVFAEGTEEVFGDDGGRGNPDLGLVEVEYRCELAPPPPPVYVPRAAPPSLPGREFDFPPAPLPSPPPASPARPSTVPQIWSSAQAPAVPSSAPAPPAAIRESDVDSAAGTGLTGRSEQSFRTVAVGPLEETATRVALRIVIGRPEAFGRARPLPGAERPVPPRPAPRP